MQESFLHFVWQHQYFSRSDLKSTSGDTLSIIFPGQYNHEDGPDFLQAQIRINQLTWVGAVEIHIHSSDWVKHHHQHDQAYQQVILHVVWEDDRPLFSSNHGKRVPTLILKGRISKAVKNSYARWDPLHKIPSFGFRHGILCYLMLLL